MMRVSDRRKSMYVDGLKEKYKVLKFSVFGLASSAHTFAHTYSSSLPFPFSHPNTNFVPPSPSPFKKNLKREKTKKSRSFPPLWAPLKTEDEEEEEVQITYRKNNDNIPLPLHHNSEIIPNFKPAKGFVDEYILDLGRWDKPCRGGEEV